METTQRLVRINNLDSDEWMVTLGDKTWWGWKKKFRIQKSLFVKIMRATKWQWFNQPMKITYHHKRFAGNIITNVERI